MSDSVAPWLIVVIRNWVFVHPPAANRTKTTHAPKVRPIESSASLGRKVLTMAPSFFIDIGGCHGSTFSARNRDFAECTANERTARRIIRRRVSRRGLQFPCGGALASGFSRRSSSATASAYSTSLGLPWSRTQQKWSRRLRAIVPECVVHAEIASGCGRLVVIARRSQECRFIELAAQQLDHGMRPCHGVVLDGCRADERVRVHIVPGLSRCEVAEDGGVP